MDSAVASVRAFNRFFTRFVGALDGRFLGTPLTLAEARLLYELAQNRDSLAADLSAALGIGPGYVSRVLRKFEERGWICRRTDAQDARQRPIALTTAGWQVFRDLDGRQRQAVVAALEGLAPGQQRDLVGALDLARILLGDPASRRFELRPFRPGDMGLIAARQSILYREVYGWGPQIEVIEGEVTSAFLRHFNPSREQCWVAELAGVMAGSVFLTDEGDALCRLRLLYVEPFARGLGIGNALVTTCIAFARAVGYHRMTLWTHTVLESARRIYAAHGFRIVDVHTHEEFGKPVQSETWQLDLTTGPGRHEATEPPTS